MFEVYRDVPADEPAGTEEGETEAGTALVLASEEDQPAARPWRWRLMLGDKVLARSEESWAKRGAAISAIAKLKTMVASAAVVERLG